LKANSKRDAAKALSMQFSDSAKTIPTRSNANLVGTCLMDLSIGLPDNFMAKNYK